MQKHQWREQTEEGMRFYQASYHGGNWVFSTQLKGEDDWESLEEVAPEMWRKLRDVLWKKYQRRRCPWKLIEQIDQQLEEEPEP